MWNRCVQNSGGGTSEVTSLWTNNSPTTAQGTFTPTLSEAITSYDGVFVEVYWGDGDPPTIESYRQYMYFPKTRYSWTGNRVLIYNGGYRNITFNANGTITFSGLGGSTLSNRVMPLKIYGVKNFSEIV